MSQDPEPSNELLAAPLEKVASFSGGTLYLVATPIGNLEDISFRAIRLLRDADLLFCEDTRHTGRLLKAFGIRRSTLSLHKFNEKSRELRVLSELESGGVVALVSDAGSPGISDPGARLAAAVWDGGFRVEAIPGPCALVTALSVSGLPCDEFFFAGFLAVKSGRRARQLERASLMESGIVFYESPHRMPKLLVELEQWFPNRKVAVCRELTKKFEEVTRGQVAEVVGNLKGRKARGEFVVVVGPLGKIKKERK